MQPGHHFCLFFSWDMLRIFCAAWSSFLSFLFLGYVTDILCSLVIVREKSDYPRDSPAPPPSEKYGIGPQKHGMIGDPRLKPLKGYPKLGLSEKTDNSVGKLCVCYTNIVR